MSVTTWAQHHFCHVLFMRRESHVQTTLNGKETQLPLLEGGLLKSCRHILKVAHVTLKFGAISVGRGGEKYFWKRPGQKQNFKVENSSRKTDAG